MISLTNDQLQVELLDPVADRARMGARYCTGGYIFQISDAAHGPLLTGPTFPNDFHWFDGQGIPDTFHFQPLRALESGRDALVIGVGKVTLDDDRLKVMTTSFCDWDVRITADAAVFITQQSHAGWAFTLTRTVTLLGRTVRSHTHLENTGPRYLPVSWFPHPFYPQPKEDTLLKLSCGVSFPKNAGYVLQPDGFIARASWPNRAGHYLALNHDAVGPISLVQRHPTLGMVAAACSYAPQLFAIWGNENTFSWEPYLERTLAQGQSYGWHIDYAF
jgi:hypothetical protein